MQWETAFFIGFLSASGLPSSRDVLGKTFSKGSGLLLPITQLLSFRCALGPVVYLTNSLLFICAAMELSSSQIFRDVVIPRNASKHHYELNDRCRSVSRVSRSPVTPKAEIPSLPSLIKVHWDADTRPVAQAGESERGTDET